MKPLAEGDLTRAELAKAVGKSKSTIRRWEESGKLRPTVNERGVRLFRVEDVRLLLGDRPIERLPQARTHVATAENAGGELAAQVFERLERGKRPVEIVIELRVHPDVVMGLAGRWSRWRRAVILTSEELAATEIAVGASLRGKGLIFVDQVRKAMAYWRRKCRGCGESRGALCWQCVRERVEAAKKRFGADAATSACAAESSPVRARGSPGIGGGDGAE